jgi:hypothetical protein
VFCVAVAEEEGRIFVVDALVELRGKFAGSNRGGGSEGVYFHLLVRRTGGGRRS